MHTGKKTAGSDPPLPDNICELCLRALIEDFDGPAFFLDTAYRHISYNSLHATMTEQLYGIKVSPGISFLDCLTNEKDRTKAKANLDRVLKTGEKLIIETVSGDEQRGRRYLNVTHLPIKAEKGKVIDIAVMAYDVTRQRITSELIAASETRYRELFDHIGSCVAVYEAVDNGNDFIIRDFNRAACSTERLNREDVIGCSVRQVFPAVENFGIFEVFQRVWQTGVPEEFPLAKYQDDRISGWRDNYIYRLPSGEVVAVYSDQTERKQTLEKLERQREEYRTIFDSVPAAIAYIDSSGVFMRVNRLMAEVFGYTPAQMVGKNLTDIFLPDDSAVFKSMHYEVLSSGLPLTGLINSFTTRPGESRWLQNDVVPYLNDRGEIIGSIFLSKDVTEQMKAEHGLKLSYETLNRALQGSVDALAKVVEMRDPYTAGHQARVTELAVAIATEMELPEERINYIQAAARLHDVGKIYVPSDILSKPGKLSKIEFEIIKTHAQGSYDIIKSINFPGPVAQIALQHHERLNGSGYPHGIRGQDIILEARILAIADVAEAMMSYRPYRPSLGLDRALDEIRQGKDYLYDAGAVDACTILFKEKNFKFTFDRSY